MFENVFLSILGAKKYNEFNLYLHKDNKTFSSFTKNISIIYFGLVLFCVVAFVLNYLEWYYCLVLILIGLPIISVLFYIFEIFKEEQRQKTIENSLQDVLLQASLFPKGTEITKILQYISEQNYKYISLEFKIALKQIKKGYSVQKSLSEICSRNKSPLLQRVINLLVVGYKSGKDMNFVLGKISQYILRIQELERERYSSLAIQKYTLLISASVLVPLILGWIQGIIAGFDFASFQTIGIVAIDAKMSLYAKYATYIYLFELSIISSYFVALIDGNRKKFVVYLLFILPIAFLVFWLV